MISRTRWQEVQSAFEKVIDIEGAQQAIELDSICGNDSDLRRSVESLLAFDGRGEAPLLNAISSAAEVLLDDHRDRLIGTRVGAYRIVSILGHGGMSTVYRGERDDSQYQQTVAIKVLQQATLHPRLRSRLHSERHILATLDHPSIARLIDSGDLEDGTPYIVMEHVDGDPIDAYCDSRNLSVRERIELFIEVCAAVHYAHRNLVVHRDIKASNIFVTDDGVPKLLDFGIAKLLAPESLSHTLPVTRLQERILTPENAAPEQVLGRAITTATDTYALGVLLYLLLTGRSPYRLLSYSQLQLERAICMDDPARPSQIVVAKPTGNKDLDPGRLSLRRGLSPQRLRARLSGDLDAIVAMAMRKEPERRYQSVEALTDDLRRHLLGNPVRARQGDWRYNGAKFFRRHLFAVVAVSAAFVGLATIAGVTLWQSHLSGIEKDRAAQQRDRAQLVSALLVEIFSEADPYHAQGKETTAKDLLDRGADKILSDPTLPSEVRAQLLDSIGLAYRRQGFYERAIPLFERALAVRRAEQPVDAQHVSAALANLSQALTDAGELVSAEGYLQQAVSLSQSGREPRSAHTAEILVQYGYFALNAKSNPEQAKRMFNNALDIYRAIPGDKHSQLSPVYSGLASVALWTGDYAAAEQHQREALNDIPATTPREHPDHTVAMAILGYILTERGKYAEAEQTLREVLEIERRVFGPDSQRVAAILSDLGLLYDREGDPARGLKLTEEAVKITTERLGPNHYMTGYYHDSLSRIYLSVGNVAAAESASRHALDIYSKTLPERHLFVASTRQFLGEVLLRRGLIAAAEAELRSAVQIDATLAGEGNWRTARSEASLGWALIEAGKTEEGEPMLVSAQSKLSATLGPQHPEAQQATVRLVHYFRSQGRDADAERVLMNKALE